MKENQYLDHLLNTPKADIDLDTLPGFEERNAKGEFDGKSHEEIVQCYVDEAIDQHHEDELNDMLAQEEEDEDD